MSGMSKPNMVLRKARDEDLDDATWVESLSTPSLSYVPHVWNMFLNDEDGEWTMEELNGKIMGIGKYSILPDGTAWLETLRVVPEAQGLGLGKRLYELWLKLSEEKCVKAMRMYTGVKNVVSAGLARRYGLSLAQTFHGVKMPAEPFEVESSFKPVKDLKEATELIMPLGEKWGGWMVMNRTYYQWSPELCEWLTTNGMVYRDKDGNVVVMGGRFMTEFQLHVGLFEGDSKVCLDYAKSEASKRGVKSIHCLYPDHLEELEKKLMSYGFAMESSPFIVMERKFE
jgi:ribosomal protein S18 acetylase RimI-like enzyme